tara:strand:- start:98 stop:2428 length:2331 start_codon:yes stop_codon:yes gene_type:complete
MKKDIKNKHKYQTRSKTEEEKTCKKNESSDDEEEEWVTDDEMEMDEIRKIISSIFPSNYMKNKVIADEETNNKDNMKKQFKKMKDKYDSSNKNKSEKSNKDSENKSKSPITKSKKSVDTKKKNDKPKESKNVYKKQKTTNKSKKTSNKSGKKESAKKKKTNDKKKDPIIEIMSQRTKKLIDEAESDSESDSETEYEDASTSEYESDVEEDSDESDEETESEEDSDVSDSDSESDSEDENIDFGKTGLFNILLTLGKEIDEELSEEETENESEEEDEEEEDDEEEDEKPDKKTKKKSKKDEEEDVISDIEAYSKMRNMIDTLSEKDKNNKEMKAIIKDFEEREKKYNKKEKKRTKKIRTKNAEKFQKVIKEKNSLNDTKFFREKLSVEEQEKVLKEVEELKKHMEIDKPYRLTLIESDIPVIYKSIAFKKINTLKYMDEGGGEYYKIKNWVDTFMQIPFGKYKNIPLTINDGVEKCHEFMENSKKTLDDAVYGMDDAKLQIMQMVGQWIANPEAVGSAIAIKGPMGTGKTTLVKDGISQILGREFAFIALGGATDSSFLEGHSYTYEGSSWGKIVEILIQCKSMNPVIYFDELDKVSDTPKGEEINGILTHLTDTTQNNKFHDKYFSELDFDLSRCLFIFSYNDETKVNSVLKDRMYRIQTKGYDIKQKTTIAKDYLIPKIIQQVKFENNDIVINDDVLKHIIEKYTETEEGVRNLKRCLEIIHTKLNLYRLMKPETNIFEKDMKLKIEFPLTVTNEIVDKLIKISEESGSWRNMYM